MSRMNSSQLASTTALIDVLDEFSEGRKGFFVDSLSVIDDDGNSLGWLNWDSDEEEYVWSQAS